MKFATLASLFVLLCALTCFAQAEGAPRIAEVGPYPNVAPGQIIELRVEGLGEQLLSPPPGDALRVLLTEDGETREARARTASPVMVREGPPAVGAGSSIGMKTFQGMTFVVPRGLHAGEAEVVVSFRGRKSAPFKLNVVERPLRPVGGGTPAKTIAPASLPSPPPAGAGQALMISVDRRRALDPDPSKTSVVFESPDGAWGFKVKPEVNSAVREPGGRRTRPSSSSSARRKGSAPARCA